ncbi:hypothetical protein ACFVSN_36030 [Kitasatospora sp. NPDC057904]|uniref:hypothetical protein n=1 Tax=unclassified Kitasatospora TaxID=2633591 RepID=UPI0036DD1798
MDDVPQGGAGGVPLHHETDATKDRPAEDQPAPAKTVRAGKPVAEQRTENPDPPQQEKD